MAPSGAKSSSTIPKPPSPRTSVYDPDEADSRGAIATFKRLVAEKGRERGRRQEVDPEIQSTLPEISGGAIGVLTMPMLPIHH
jgi:hypothetical protein